MNLTDNKPARIFTLCAMYFSQGMPFGFVTYLLASYMAGKGLDVATIGRLTAISTLPWIFKWIWGPLIDRFTIRSMGRRRPWIIFAQFCMMLTLAAMILIPDVTENLNFLFALVFTANVFASMQDVSVDALAVEVLKENERGSVNGLMFGSASMGAAFSSIVLAWVMGNYGLREAMIVQACVLFGIMMIPIFLRERNGEKLLPWTKGQAMGVDLNEASTSNILYLKTILKAFSIRSALLMIGLCLVIKIAIELHVTVGTVYYIQELGWDSETFASTRGKVELFAFLGCFLGGILADLFGHKKIAITSTILFGVSYVTYALLPQLWGNHLAVQLFFIAEGVTYGALSVSIFAMCMGISLPAVAGTQFTVYMATMNLSATLGKSIAGWFDGRMSYSEILIFWGIFQAVVITTLLLFINPKERKMQLELEERSKDLLNQK